MISPPIPPKFELLDSPLEITGSALAAREATLAFCIGVEVDLDSRNLGQIFRRDISQLGRNGSDGGVCASLELRGGRSVDDAGREGEKSRDAEGVHIDNCWSERRKTIEREKLMRNNRCQR